MFLDIDSLIVDGIKIGQYIQSAKYDFHKTWSSDTGRNLAGNMVGTLKGIFPKITVQFNRLNKEQLELLAPILDSATQSVTYYDPKLKTNKTISTYTGDWGTNFNNRHNSEAFSISFIARSKR